MIRVLLAAVLGALCCPSLFAQSHGSVAGTVFDGATGNPVPQVLVTVAGGTASAKTDTDGRFVLQLAPGTYRLQFAIEGYFESSIESLTVVAGQQVEASTVVSSRSVGTSVDVLEKVDASVSTAEAMLVERRLAPVVSDTVSSEEIKETVASDAAGALEKVTGVSIVDDGYVYVRGLGERYSATMLNNSILPTTEPERRVVPLDLFPASLIDSIKVLKTYTPDLPGEFSGGLVQLQTVEFPRGKTFSVGLSGSMNTETTFQRFESYPGGSRDFFGFDDGSRGVPSSIPSERRLFPGSFTPDQLQAFGRAFSPNYEAITRSSIRPSQGVSIAGGNTIGRFGLVGAFTFSNKPSRHTELQRYLVNAGGGKAEVFTEYPDFRSATESIRMGGVVNAAMRLNEANKVVFRNTWTRDSEKEARVFRGLNGGINSVIEDTRLRWVERGIYSTSVEGEHVIAPLRNSLVRWQMTYSRSTRHEPDLRESIRGQREDGSFTFLSLPQSGLRFYNDLEDRIYEPLADFSTPFYKGIFSGLVKAGFRATLRDRDFQARRFRFVPIRANTLNFSLPTNQLLGPSNIRPDGFEVRENTRGTDTYQADMKIYGAYAMLDLVMGPRWRVVGGVRFEDAETNVQTIDPLVPGSVPAIATLSNRDPLPGVNVIFALTPKQNLRFGYGRTLSRPDFRELSPFDFTNVLGGFNTVGNPNLRRAKIDNFDGRWEYFMGGDHLIAVSYFVKDFTDPIEVTIQPTTDLRQSFVNAAGAKNQGIELEFRRNLGFLSDRLIPFSLHTNFTVVGSNVDIPSAQALLLTSKARPLVGQSRYVYNIIAEWAKPEWRSQARFFVNTVSRRITDVGTFGLPDIYQERQTFLDAAYQYQLAADGKWNLRFTAENLGNNHYLWTQADITQRSYRLGRTFSLGLSFSLF